MLDREQVWEVIKSMDLVQNMSSVTKIKQAGRDIVFSSAEDEFSSHLIRMIPTLLIWLGKISTVGHPESLEAIRQDIKEWISQQETLLGIYLEESKFKELLEKEDESKEVL